ncbi:hypothetical protein [Rhizobium leguminosarum]|nr:hypothetical protein [Rhizobium leguminosarum]
MALIFLRGASRQRGPQLPSQTNPPVLRGDIGSKLVDAIEPRGV